MAGNSRKPRIVLQRKVQLSRNISDIQFPGSLSVDDRLNIIYSISRDIDKFKLGVWTPADPRFMSEDELEQKIEQQIFPHSFRNDFNGKNVWINAPKNARIVMNDCDHLRFETADRNKSFEKLYADITAIEARFAKHIPFAFDKKLGYLTARTDCVGTAMKASVLLHLPGIVLTGQEQTLLKGLEPQGLKAVSFLGPDEKFVGNLFWISNTGSLGQTEAQILEHLESFVQDVIHAELAARQFLDNEHPLRMPDFCSRAQAVLCATLLLTVPETLNAFSGLRLANDLGIKEFGTKQDLDDLMIKILPASVVHWCGGGNSEESRAATRAEFMRAIFRNE